MTDKDVGALWRSAMGIGQQCRPRPPSYVAEVIRKLVEEALGSEYEEHDFIRVLRRFDIDPETYE